MTTERPETGSSADDQLLEELYPQINEHLADLYAGDDDVKAGRARFVAWLDEHTGPAGDDDRGSVAVPGKAHRPARVMPRRRLLARSRRWLSRAAATIGIAAALSGIGYFIKVAADHSSGMADVFELVAVTAVVAFLLGGVFGVIFIVANGIHTEEKVARQRARERQRATTLYDEPTSNLTRGVRRVTGIEKHTEPDVRH